VTRFGISKNWILGGINAKGKGSVWQGLPILAMNCLNLPGLTLTERKFTEKLAQDFRPLVHQTQGWFRTHFFGQ